MKSSRKYYERPSSLDTPDVTELIIRLIQRSDNSSYPQSEMTIPLLSISGIILSGILLIRGVILTQEESSSARVQEPKLGSLSQKYLLQVLLDLPLFFRKQKTSRQSLSPKLIWCLTKTTSLSAGVKKRAKAKARKGP